MQQNYEVFLLTFISLIKPILKERSFSITTVCPQVHPKERLFVKKKIINDSSRQTSSRHTIKHETACQVINH